MLGSWLPITPLIALLIHLVCASNSYPHWFSAQFSYFLCCVFLFPTSKRSCFGVAEMNLRNYASLLLIKTDALKLYFLSLASSFSHNFTTFIIMYSPNLTCCVCDLLGCMEHAQWGQVSTGYQVGWYYEGPTQWVGDVARPTTLTAACTAQGG